MIGFLLITDHIASNVCHFSNLDAAQKALYMIM